MSEFAKTAVTVREDDFFVPVDTKLEVKEQYGDRVKVVIPDDCLRTANFDGKPYETIFDASLLSM